MKAIPLLIGLALSVASGTAKAETLQEREAQYAQIMQFMPGLLVLKSSELTPIVCELEERFKGESASIRDELTAATQDTLRLFSRGGSEKDAEVSLSHWARLLVIKEQRDQALGVAARMCAEYEMMQTK